MKAIFQHALRPVPRWAWLSAGVFILLAVLLVGAQPALAQEETPEPGTDDYCLVCHEQDNLFYNLDNGEQLGLHVNARDFHNAVHAGEGIACVDCHTDIEEYPHPEFAFASVRDFTVQMNVACMGCHEEATAEYHDGRHAELRAGGMEEAPLCTDCHTAHDVQRLAGDGAAIAGICQQCHAEIYDVYAESVHGAALLDGNPDVPNCAACHENHANTGPSDPGYVLFSPQICAECHADEQLMNQYGINTEVFDTYVADFHGTTITIFEQTAPDQVTNKPVCADCHGVHNILPPTDENSSVLKANLITTCQRCHPGAPPSFSDAWLSHHTPSWQHNTLVFVVDLFYKFFIPGVLGGMALFIATDIYRSGLFGLFSSAKDAHGKDGHDKDVNDNE